MQEDFGDRVKVEYYELSDPEMRAKYADVVKAVEEHGLAYPLTAINGVFRFAGGVSYYAILRAVQEALGIPAGES